MLPLPGTSQSSCKCSIKMWWRVHYLPNEFWNRWKRQYTQLLQSRSKWPTVIKNVKVNETVIVKKQNLPRNSWKLGSVSEVIPSQDGLVRKERITMADSLMLLENERKMLTLKGQCTNSYCQLSDSGTGVSPPKSLFKYQNSASIFYSFTVV